MILFGQQLLRPVQIGLGILYNLQICCEKLLIFHFFQHTASLCFPRMLQLVWTIEITVDTLYATLLTLLQSLWSERAFTGPLGIITYIFSEHYDKTHKTSTFDYSMVTTTFNNFKAHWHSLKSAAEMQWATALQKNTSYVYGIQWSTAIHNAIVKEAFA